MIVLDLIKYNRKNIKYKKYVVVIPIATYIL